MGTERFRGESHVNRPHNVSTYSNHGCRCDECRVAWAEYQQNLRRVRREEGRLPEGGHGRNAYQNYGCRCEKCTRANTAYDRRWRAQR